MQKHILTGLLICVTGLTSMAQHTAKSTSKVPKAFLGHWQKGTFSLTSFEEANGKYVGPANEMSVSYVIKENGMAREYFISNSTSYNCRTQILGFREGKFSINEAEQSFIFQPSTGYYTMTSCMSKTASKKPYGAKDLYPAYQVKCFLKTDENGQPVLVNDKNLQLKKITDASNAKMQQAEKANTKSNLQHTNSTSSVAATIKTAFSIMEENNPNRYEVEDPNMDIQLIDGDKLRITMTDAYPNGNPMKINISLNGYKGPGKYEIKSKENGVVSMTDDNESYQDDAYWASYYRQSNYGGYDFYNSPKVILEIKEAANGTLYVSMDIKLYHLHAASGAGGISFTRTLSLKGTIIGTIKS